MSDLLDDILGDAGAAVDERGAEGDPLELGVQRPARNLSEDSGDEDGDNQSAANGGMGAQTEAQSARDDALFNALFEGDDLPMNEADMADAPASANNSGNANNSNNERDNEDEDNMEREEKRGTKRAAEDEDEKERPQKRRRVSKKSAKESNEGADKEEEEKGEKENEDGDEKDEDVHVDMSDGEPSEPEMDVGEEEEDEEVAASGRKKKGKKKSKATTEPTEEGGEEKPPELTEQQRLDREFEEEVLRRAVRPKKTRRVVRARGGEETGGEDVGGASKEERDLLASMTARAAAAAERDRRAVEAQQPAPHKLELLDELTRVLQRRTVLQGECEPALIEAVRTWLEPLQDALPNARIRSALLQALSRMELDQDMLMMTGIGRPVLLLSRHPKETLDNRRLAQRLVQKWSAPIFAQRNNSSGANTAASEGKTSAPASSSASKSAAASANSATGNKAAVSAASRTLTGKLSATDAPKEHTRDGRVMAVIPSKARFDQAQPPPSNWSDEKGKKKSEGDRLSASLSSTIRDAKKQRAQSKRATEMGVNRLPNKF